MSQTTMSDTMRAKVDSVLAAHIEWQRGGINEREYLRRADITDTEHAEIERGLSPTATRPMVLVRIANVLYPTSALEWFQAYNGNDQYCGEYATREEAIKAPGVNYVLNQARTEVLYADSTAAHYSRNPLVRKACGF